MNYGVVAEFNPLHNGHKFLLDSLKENGENTVTVVMSESFVQRGESACMSPYARTETALKCGADLVLSLPVAYATASAERFAMGGVSALGSLGCIDTLAFGSESGNAEVLKKVAQAITSEEFSPTLENRLSEGLSFPTARQKALRDMYGDEFADALISPNDILGVEYIKAINAGGFKMSVYPVKREGASHDSSELSENICSASALREMMKSGDDFSRFLPDESLKILQREIKENRAPADFGKLHTAILYKLRTMTPDDFREVPDVSEGLEYRFCEAVRTSTSLDEILEKIKTKRYTHSRLRRIILCSFLGTKKEDTSAPLPFIRVLGFSEKGAGILKIAKETATLPLVTKPSDIKNLGEGAKRLFDLECKARDIFSLTLPKTEACGREMTDKFLVL